MKLSRLASRDNFREVEREWQYEFVYHVLSSIGIPDNVLSGCFPEEGLSKLTIDHKVELRQQMKKYSVTILDDRDGGIKIFVERTLVAEWKKCTFTLREDLAQIDPTKRLYIEIEADVWTVFDGENDE